MASVHLDFIPPAIPDVDRLIIYESDSPNGVFSEIETVTPVGTYPDYISEYTTENATSAVGWFAVAWADSKDFVTTLSAPIQGGTETLVGKIVSMMMLRDPNINEGVAFQEAQAAVSKYFAVTDPMVLSSEGISPNILSGLTNLALVRTYISQVITGTASADSWTAGIVSMTSSSGSTKTLDSLKTLLAMANQDLGLNYSIKFLLKEIEVGGGYTQVAAVDLSRSIFELQ
jgi:hypothetical protein